MIYVSSSCIRKKKIAEAVQDMAENGIASIELSGGTGYYDGIEQDLKLIKEKYRLQYACHAYFPPPKIPFVVNLASCNDVIYKKSMEHYDNCIELLGSIECNVLSVHAGFLIEIGENEIGKKVSNTVTYDEDEAYSRFCYAYEKLSRKCRERNINLYLENNVISQENYKAFGCRNYFMMTDYKSIMYMKEQIEFDLLLDLGHLYVSSNTLNCSYKQECASLKEYVRWIHISENDGIRDEHKPLKNTSKILKEFCNIYSPGMDVTLETVGSMKEVCASIALLRQINGKGSCL